MADNILPNFILNWYAVTKEDVRIKTDNMFIQRDSKYVICVNRTINN